MAGATAQLRNPPGDPRPEVTALSVKVRRVIGEGAGAKTVWDDDVVRIYELSIGEACLMLQRLTPAVLSIGQTSSMWALVMEHPAEFFAAIGVAIRWPAARVALLRASDFLRVASELNASLRPMYDEGTKFFARLAASSAMEH